MKKLWIRKRAVSTMIGGVIVLGLFLTALVSMILIMQQYDSYQQSVNAMKQADMTRFAENLGFTAPGLVRYSGNPRSCGSGTCNMYTMIVNDFASNGSLDVGVQIARIYINSSQLYSQSGCISLCILGPSTTPSPYVFNSSQRYINPGEYQHNVVLWLPSTITLPETDSIGQPQYALNSISIVTTRGRQFSFSWPIPPAGFAAGSSGGGGGTGLYIGPLVITFQKTLIFYSTHANPTPTLPIGGTNGYWVFPPPPPAFIIYLKIQTDRGTPSDVYLTAQSVLEISQFNSPGNVVPLFIVAPISQSLCNSIHPQDTSINCFTSYGYYSSGGNNGDPSALVAYSACSTVPYSNCPNRYKIPRPSSLQLLNNERGDPVVVAFAATTASGTSSLSGNGGFSGGQFATTFLGLTYVYNDQTGGGDYTFAITLPFMAFCFDDAPGSLCGI